MRYEFERDGHTVASVLWEGPGQVTVEVSDPAERPVFDRFFGEEVVYLSTSLDFGGDMGEGGLASRRRDWTPWEFERQGGDPPPNNGGRVRRVRARPGRGGGGGGG